MKISKKIGVVLMVLVLLTVFALPTFVSCKKKAEAKPYIAVVSKGEQHDFWQQVKLGAKDAAAKYDVDMTFLALLPKVMFRIRWKCLTMQWQKSLLQ
jgi:ABC-type sugar transport system substrate-binding protein